MHYLAFKLSKLELKIKRIKVSDTLTADELKKRMLNSKDIQEHNRWQALYLAKTRMLLAKEIADIIGVSVFTINKWVYDYNHKGEQSVYSQSRGGNRTSFLSWEEEEQLLQDISRRADKGLLVVVKTIKAEIEARIGHAVSKDYPYDLLLDMAGEGLSPGPYTLSKTLNNRLSLKKTPGIPGCHSVKLR